MVYLLLLALAIIFHELGHFVIAKCFGVRVKRFCLFYDAGFCLYSTGKRFATEYRIGWLPIGGYVSFTTPEGKELPKWSILAQHPLKRIAISLAGVTVNLLLAYGCMFAWARNYVLPESQYSNAYVMQKAGEVTISRLNDYRHVLVVYYLPVKTSETQKVETDSSIENHSLLENGKQTYTNRFFPSSATISSTDIKVKNLLWRFSGFNLVLFLFNLLPIPPLDGAQSLFSLYELITRKPLNEKLRVILVLSGTVLLLGMLSFDILSNIYHYITS